MKTSRWTNVAFWRRRFAGDRSIDPPDEGNNICPESTFGLVEYNNSQNFPCSVNAAYWIWCPTAHALAGYLRYCYAVGCLDELLEVTSWQEAEGAYRSVEDILEDAPPEVIEDARCDTKTMLSAVEELDGAVKEKTEEGCFRKSKRAIRRFLGGINKSAWLKNHLALFDTPAAVGRHVVKTLELEGADVEEELGMSKAEWRRFCSGAARDRKAGKAFAGALEGFAQV